MESSANLSDGRCINIDWLEVYCLESGVDFPHDASYFRSKGYEVRERDYGTRQYNQMFTVLDVHGEAFCEIRRDPVSGSMADRVKGIFSPYSCHIKLSNRYCYHDNAVNLFSEFLTIHHYDIQRLFRLDLCLDFERFDRGDNPKDFLRRYMSGKFTKINQANVGAHGTDTWEQRDWNSLSWGAPKSMVSTKFYNKTLELLSVKDKPYIRYAWWCAGLVHDWQTLTKVDKNGVLYRPDIWRVEFSIRSSAKGWVMLEDNNRKKPKAVAVPHALGVYQSKDDQLRAFANLAHHYFHFKHYVPGKRKDLCEDKVLFVFNKPELRATYKLDRLMTERPQDKALVALKNRLEHYRMTHYDEQVRKACSILLENLDKECMRNMVPTFDSNEAKILQALISRRIKNPGESVTDAIQTIKALINLQDSIF